MRRASWSLAALLCVSCVHRFPGPGQVPAAQEYRSLADGGASALSNRVLAAGRGQGLVHDARLDEVARVLAEDYRLWHEVPPATYLRWLLRRHGIAAGYHRLWAGWVTGSNQRVMRLDEMLEEELAKVKDLGGKSFGIARASGPTPTAQVLLLADSRLVLEPIPRQPKPGEVITLKGTVAGVHDGAVQVYAPGEREPRLALVDQRGAWEPQQLTVPSTPGRYWLELRFSEDKGPTMLVPLLVGGVEDVPLEVGSTPAELEVAARAWAQQVRAQAGLAPLESDPAADAIVRRRAELRAESPADSEAALRAAGYLVVNWKYKARDGEHGNSEALAAIDRPSEAAFLLKADVQGLAVGASRVGDSWWLVLETLGPKQVR
ncbi:MAG: hypothetical protein Q8L48_20895 [Archangium sp.]|nr:hypothetical protein [Archangium sp.]